MVNDEALSASSSGKEDDGEDENNADSAQSEPPKPRKCYIFCPAGDRESLFAEVDHRTAAPLIPAFWDYVLEELIARKILRQLKVFTLTEKLDAWTLELLPDDKNVVDILEQGLKEGKISIPGAAADGPDGFDGVTSVTSYLNTFGVTVAERIRNQFEPLFDPASEPLSEEVLAVNDYIQQQAGHSLYDAQLAVAEAVKRQLDRRSAAFIVAECGSGKTKIGSTALGALHSLLAAQRRRGAQKTFNLVMCPSHVTRKWVREIGENLPDTYAVVVRSITEFDRLYAMYEAGDRSVFAVFSKERAAYLPRTKNAAVLEKLEQITADPKGLFPVAGAVRWFPLSTYIKKKYRGRIDGFLCDELHEYNNNSGQGDAMAELFGVAKQFVGMTATLINGYSSGIFHLLYRVVPGLMKKDGKSCRSPGDFDAEYSVVESTYETTDADYSSNRRTNKRKTQTRQLPGVSPMVFSRFLLEYTAFLSLSDMGKNGMSLGHNCELSPHTGYVSNKTLFIALNYQERTEQINAETLNDILDELDEVERVQNRLTYYVSILSPQQERLSGDSILRAAVGSKLPRRHFNEVQ